MKRRLNIATALVHQPSLLILDEPTAGVDPQSRNAILETTERLRADGVTVIYTTHYMEEAQRVCDRVAIVDHGKVLATDSVSALIDKHGGKKEHPRRSTFTLLTATRATRATKSALETKRIETADPLSELNKIAEQHNVKRFHLERPTLERVFLKPDRKEAARLMGALTALARKDIKLLLRD